MRLTITARASLGVALLANVAMADERWEVGASLGYAAPVGSARRGDKTSDTTSALAPFSLDASYRVSRYVGTGASFGYGLGIPTLCASAGECVSSLGHDLSLSAHAKFFLPALSRFEPFVVVGPGWEWLTTKLVDSAAQSSRIYSGPVFILEIASPLRLGRRITLGPVVGGTLGTFTAARLDAPGISRDDAGGHAMHAWISASIRCAVRF